MARDNHDSGCSRGREEPPARHRRHSCPPGESPSACIRNCIQSPHVRPAGGEKAMAFVQQVAQRSVGGRSVLAVLGLGIVDRQPLRCRGPERAGKAPVKLEEQRRGRPPRLHLDEGAAAARGLRLRYQLLLGHVAAVGEAAQLVPNRAPWHVDSCRTTAATSSPCARPAPTRVTTGPPAGRPTATSSRQSKAARVSGRARSSARPPRSTG